ncbi:hypothetical protein Tco_0750476 [Tanacetum coccineum]|uniref:Uncharacterized protein n=1 Tax=Tanacetum coccineum TaxID=301880 RepID=A0ABQ4Z481_9ASTR
MQAPLRRRFSDLSAVDMKLALHQRMYEDESYETHKDHKNLFDALQKSLERDHSDQLASNLKEARLIESRRNAAIFRTFIWVPLVQPPPPLTSSRSQGFLQEPGGQALSSSKVRRPCSTNLWPWTTITLNMSSNWHHWMSKNSGNNHSPKADSRKDWWKSLPEEDRPATLEPTWIIPSSNTSDVAYEVVKPFYPDVIHLQFQMEECHKLLTDQVDWTNPEGNQVRINVNRPLPLGGPPDRLTIQTQFFFNKDLEYLRYDNKGSCPALSISKMKAARYPDFGLELLVPEQMWIEDVCSYDISAKYGIAHWWFTRQKFYIDRHDAPSRRKEVRSTMRILSVIRIKAYSRYGYDYLSEIGHLDHLPGSDKRMLSTTVKLWTRNLVIRQRVEDFQLGIESYQKQLNLTKPGWDVIGYEFKHDYIIIKSPRALVFPVNSKERKIMRYNEIYKFSDGTMSRILEALDYKVKEYQIKRFNPGMNTRFWTQKDVTRSKEFMAAIERRLKTRRIFRNLECFVGGRVCDIDYRLLQRTE